MQLSPNFHLSEFVTSQTAARRGLDNTPPAWAIDNLVALCQNVLEPVRRYYAAPVIVSSGYRAPAVNKAVGGSTTSQHCKGQAADIEVPGVSNVELAQHIRDRLLFDQLILEFYTPGDPSSGWVHVSFAQRCRNEALTARRVAQLGRMRTQYVAGIVV